MRTYHYIWLDAHPTRSEHWLKCMLSEGFEMHHVDGNHNNDNPYNLALVYGPDHARMHANGFVIQEKPQEHWTFWGYAKLWVILWLGLVIAMALFVEKV